MKSPPPTRLPLLPLTGVYLKRAIGLTVLALGGGLAVGTVWSVLNGDRATWYLLTLVPSLLSMWWIGVGFLRWAADTERRAEVPNEVT